MLGIDEGAEAHMGHEARPPRRDLPVELDDHAERQQVAFDLVVDQPALEHPVEIEIGGDEPADHAVMAQPVQAAPAGVAGAGRGDDSQPAGLPGLQEPGLKGHQQLFRADRADEAVHAQHRPGRHQRRRLRSRHDLAHGCICINSIFQGAGVGTPERGPPFSHHRGTG